MHVKKLFRTGQPKRLAVLAASAVAVFASSVALAGPALAYSGPAAASYADQWATGRNSFYPSFSDDCTNFVSQALNAGGLPQALPPGVSGNSSNDLYWYFLHLRYGYWLSHSWSVVVDLYNHLYGGHGTPEGSFSYDNGAHKAPAFTPNSVVTGDVLFYDWGTGLGISHTAMQVGWGTDQYGYYGNWVDEHTSDRRHIFWTLKDAPGNTNWMTTSVYFMHIH